MTRATPRFGLGTSPLGDRRTAVGEDDAREVVRRVLAAGVGMIDTAPLYGYGLAEKRVGAAIAGAPDGGPLLITKVGRRLAPVKDGGVRHPGYVGDGPLGAMFDYSAQGALASFEESLERLGRDRIDVLLLHDVGALVHGAAAEAVERTALDGAWRGLERLKAAGRVGRIGLGVNEWQVCDRWLDLAEPDVFLIAGQCTLLEDQLPPAFLERCALRGVEVAAAAPFASGLLASAADDAFHNYRRADFAAVTRARLLETACRRHGATLLAAALHYPLRRTGVRAVLAGARTPAQADALAAATATPPSPAAWAALDELRLGPAGA